MTTLIIGSYTHSLPHVVAKGSGISLLRLDGETARIEPVDVIGAVRNPTYLALSPDEQTLYCVEELDQKDGAAVAILKRDVDQDRWSLSDRFPVPGDAPCHVSVDESGKWLFISNYGSGNFIAYPLGADGLRNGEGIDIRRAGRGANPDRQEGPHVHQATVSPDNRHVLICDAGTDEIARYPLSEDGPESQPDLVIKAKPGSLPRHLTFSRDGKYIFALQELGCAITSYAYADEGLQLLTEVSTLPADYVGMSAGAAIHLHPNGRFLYASNRGDDSIAAFEVGEERGELIPIGWFATGGRTPRDFAIDPSGRFLVAANQDSDTLVAFSIDRASGALSPFGNPYSIGTPVCVLFAGN